MLRTDVDIKTLMDELAARYETEDFIKDDPVQFPHRYSKAEDIEIAGFIASIFAYGNRKAFIGKLNQLFAMMGESPYKYVMAGMFELNGFNYRFMKEEDIVAILQVLNKLYREDGGLAGLFSRAAQSENLMQYVTDYFYKCASEKAGDGFYFAIPNPAKGGAMKRMWMYLRWMVRKSAVDLGVWKFMTPADLRIPMDVHVARISRELGILKRNSNDKKAVEELSAFLRSLDAQDPIKYDFALFGYGVNN
ncbi:MAG: TIGR02757 family protein [Fusobacterium sp.]|nr:TIGR02757 family protein [Fusobacterium sp.]